MLTVLLLCGVRGYIDRRVLEDPSTHLATDGSPHE
jgi:hypothetical protein